MEPVRPLIVFFWLMDWFKVEKTQFLYLSKVRLTSSYFVRQNCVFFGIFLSGFPQFVNNLCSINLCSINCYFWILLRYGRHIKANTERIWCQESRCGNLECRSRMSDLPLCSFTYWRLEIRMSNVKSPIRNVLQVADLKISHAAIHKHE